MSDVPAVSMPTFPPSNFIGFLKSNIDDEFFPVLTFTFNFFANDKIFE